MKEENINKLRFAVIDASLVASFLMPDEQGDFALKIFDRNTLGKLKLLSTFLLPFEVSNLLFAAVRSKRVDKNLALKLLKRFLKFKIELLPVDYERVLTTSIDCEISVYDASYLFLAEKEKLQLLTLDRRLKSFTDQN